IKVEKYATQHVVQQKHHFTHVTEHRLRIPYGFRPQGEHGHSYHMMGYYSLYFRRMTHHEVTTRHVTQQTHQKVSLHTTTHKPPALHLTIPPSKTTRTTKVTKENMPLLGKHDPVQPHKRPILPDPPNEKHASAHEKAKADEQT